MITREITMKRLRLRRNGFHLVPLEGKVPYIKGWQEKFLTTNENEIRCLWPEIYHLAANTGVLAKYTPGLDIDIMIEAAAEAVEMLAREHFEERGDIHVRFGKPPKRLIMLRTTEPFDKLYYVFKAPDGSEHKIEILCNGQQYVRFLAPAPLLRPGVRPSIRGAPRAVDCPRHTRRAARGEIRRRASQSP
jgi:bifunctional DNA primase/polymerase-like protein